MFVEGGKDKYSCLLSLVRHEKPELYEVILDLCLDGIFRHNAKKCMTLLMPTDALVSQLRSLIDNDKDHEAIQKLRSLILSGRFKKKDFTSDATIKTFKYGSEYKTCHLLKNPKKVGDNVANSNKAVELDINNVKVLAHYVLQYNGDNFPETEEKSDCKVKDELVGSLANKKVAAGSSHSDKSLDKIKSLIVHNNSEQTLHNFHKAVCCILACIQKEDEAKFNRAKYYLAENPILSFYFLTLPNNHNALCPNWNDLDFSTSITDEDMLDMALTADGYSVTQEALQMISSARKRLASDSDKLSLISSIKRAYKELLPKLQSKNAVDSYLASNTKLKMTMDELRFMCDSCDSFEDVKECLDHLKLIDWTNPPDGYVILNSKMYGGFVKPKEAIESGPMAFLKSTSFLYIPLSEEIKTKLESTITAGSVDPSTISRVVYSGGAMRKKMSSVRSKQKDSLHKFVNQLSKKQREALKAML